MLWKIASLEPVTGVIEIPIAKAVLKGKQPRQTVKISGQKEMGTNQSQHLTPINSERRIGIYLHSELGQNPTKGPCNWTLKNGGQEDPGPGWWTRLIILTTEITVFWVLHSTHLWKYLCLCNKLPHTFTAALGLPLTFHMKKLFKFFWHFQMAAKNFQKTTNGKKFLEEQRISYLGLQIELALLSSDSCGVVFKPMLLWGSLYKFSGATFSWGNEHHDISMYFHTRFSIRNIHKYVCVIYSFMSDVCVFSRDYVCCPWCLHTLVSFLGVACLLEALLGGQWLTDNNCGLRL